MGLQKLYVKHQPCRSLEYNIKLIGENIVEISYINRRSGTIRKYIIESNHPIDEMIVDEAMIIAENLYTIIDDHASKPNIPLYSLIISLLRYFKGLSYKCKIARDRCPLKIYKMYNGTLIQMSVASIIEQVYRVTRKYNRW